MADGDSALNGADTQDEYDLAAEEAAFAAQSTGEPAEEADTPDEDVEAEDEQAGEAEDDEGDEPEDEAEPDDEQEQERKELERLLADLPDIGKRTQLSETQIRQIHGKLGEINQRLQALSAQNANGSAGVKISKENFKKLNTDYPELAEMLAEDLASLTLPSGQGANPELLKPMIDAEVTERVSAVERKMEVRLLTHYHKDWKQVVKSDPFKAWIGKQPQEVQTEFNNSWDADYLSDKLSQYKTETQQTEQAAKKRQERLSRAVMPRTNAKVERGLTTEEEAFAAFSR